MLRVQGSSSQACGDTLGRRQSRRETSSTHSPPALASGMRLRWDCNADPQEYEFQALVTLWLENAAVDESSMDKTDKFQYVVMGLVLLT
jgi:hypothetical protein